MRNFSAALLGAAAFIVSTPPATAQQDAVSEAAKKTYAACIANVGGSPAECGCATGFFAARLKEDEFSMISVIVPFIDAQGELTDEQGALNAATAERDRAGMSQERFGQIMQVFSGMDALGAEADRVCVPVRDKAEE